MIFLRRCCKPARVVLEVGKDTGDGWGFGERSFDGDFMDFDGQGAVGADVLEMWYQCHLWLMLALALAVSGAFRDSLFNICQYGDEGLEGRKGRNVFQSRSS